MVLNGPVQTDLLDQHVKVLGYLRCEACGCESHSVSPRPSRGKFERDCLRPNREGILFIENRTIGLENAQNLVT